MFDAKKVKNDCVNWIREFFEAFSARVFLACNSPELVNIIGTK